MTRMALELSNFDYDVLDRFLEMILNEHRAGNLALSEARDAISEAFSMAAFDNRGGVTRYMQGLIEVRGLWESPLLAGNGEDQVAMAVRRYSGPKMRSSRQGDGAGSRESEQMTTPT